MMTGDAEIKRPFVQMRSHLYYNIAIVLTGLLIFVFIPLFFLNPEQTKQFINNGREQQVAGDVLKLIGFFWLFLGGFYWLLILLRRREMGAHVVMFALSWVALSGFLLPLTAASGLLDLRDEPTHIVNMIIVIILSGIFAGFFVSRHAKVLESFMAIFLSIAVLTSLPRAFSQFEKHNGEPKAVSMSSNKNLLLVGFDGLPGHVVRDLLTTRTELRAHFKDFTFFENVASTSPATDASLMGIVYGNHDFTKRHKSSALDPETLFFNQTDRINFTTGFKYNSYNRHGTKIAAGEFGAAEQRNELFEMYQNVGTRLAGKFGAQLAYWVDALAFPRREGKFYTTVDGFDRLFERLVVDSDKPAVIYTHFTLTHWPTVIDEDCTNRDFQWAWLAENQNINGIRKGAICALGKYVELMGTLKTMGVYDNTTIVFLSDHGKPVTYYDTRPSNLAINGGETLGFDRYQPFLMIKPAGSSNETMAMSDAYTLLDDLAQTNCNIFEKPEKCERRPGRNLLDETDVSPASFFVHVVKDANSSWGLSDHKAVQLPRNIPLVDAMMASPDIELTERR